MSLYPNLEKYGVFAVGALTVTSTVTINDGDWFSTPVAGTFAVGTGTPAPQLNTTDASNALVELDALITSIETVTSSLPSENIGAGGADRTFSPNINYQGSGITYGVQTLTFDAGGNAAANFYVTDIGTGFTFTDTIINLTGGASACNIFWLANNGATGAFTATRTTIPGVIITSAGFTATSGVPMSFTGHVYSKGAATFSNVGGSLTVNSTPCQIIVCYAKGTLILTKRGFVPIESIKAGYNVVTKGKIHNDEFIMKGANLEIKPVIWISKFKVKNLNSKSRPICIKKGALGKNSPFKDLYVSPAHRLLLDGKMVSAMNIVNGDTIYQDNECDSVEYYHLECEEHSAIFANGILAESYTDADNRHAFENSIRIVRKPNVQKSA